MEAAEPVTLLTVDVCRFDGELSGAQEEVQRERSLREKLAREKDVLSAEVFSLRQQLEVLWEPLWTGVIL